MELIASPAVAQAAIAYQDATAAVNTAFIAASETAIAANDGLGVESFRTAQVAIAAAMEERQLTRLYIDLRELMRGEIFDLALQADLRPSEAEQTSLRDELRSLRLPDTEQRGAAPPTPSQGV